MANDLTDNPYIIDTASAAVLVAGRLRIKSIRWVGASVAGHVAEIQDSNNRVIWRSQATGANNVEGQIIERVWENGFRVPTLQSGTLYIDHSFL